MKINYRILWIDDTPEWVESQTDKIEEYLFDFGFVLKPEIKSSYQGIDFSQYDIIAVDCNLGDENGIDALGLIRSKDIYTEILFYSQDGELKLREEMKTNRIDGVYCASREDSIEKLKKVIFTTIHKTQEINNLRGLVMAETSDLDKIVKAILLKAEWSQEQYEERHKSVDEFHDTQKKKLQKLLPFDSKNIPLFIHGHFISRTSFWALEKFLSEDDWNSIKEYERIMDKRNVLAHGVEISSSVDEITIEMTKRNGDVDTHVFTSDDFVTLRKEVKDFKDKFEKLTGSEK